MTKKMLIKNNHPRASLAEETAEAISKILCRVLDERDHAASELSHWRKSRSYLQDIIDTYGEKSEESALMVVANRNIENWKNRVLTLDERESKLKDYAERVQLAKNSFDIFDGTRYLMEKAGGDMASIQSPETELKEIRRSVYSIEGYKELLG